MYDNRLPEVLRVLLQALKLSVVLVFRCVLTGLPHFAWKTVPSTVVVGS